MPRPKQFDPEEALTRAMEVFWAKGYGAASVQELVDAMGINRFSLYDTFGDKRHLYLAALDRYGEQVAREAFGDLETAADGAAAIRTFFQSQVERFSGDAADRGCLLANCSAEVAASDPEAARRVRRGLERARRAFRAALERAQQAGDLAADRDLDDLARFFALSSNALALIAKARPGRALLEGYVRVVVGVLDRRA